MLLMIVIPSIKALKKVYSQYVPAFTEAAESQLAGLYGERKISVSS
jgi:hypothetical protein